MFTELIRDVNVLSVGLSLKLDRLIRSLICPTASQTLKQAPLTSTIHRFLAEDEIDAAILVFKSGIPDPPDPLAADDLAHPQGVEYLLPSPTRSLGGSQTAPSATRLLVLLDAKLFRLANKMKAEGG